MKYWRPVYTSPEDREQYMPTIHHAPFSSKKDHYNKAYTRASMLPPVDKARLILSLLSDMPISDKSAACLDKAIRHVQKLKDRLDSGE